MPQIEMEGIYKSYRVAKRPQGRFALLRGAFSREHQTVRALDGVGFEIGQGELVGYIGPNGAGKSTSVKVMSGILTPDAGSCRVMGLVPWKQRTRHVERIGVVFGQRSQLWWDVPVSDSFNLLRDIYAIPANDYRQRRKQLVERMELGALVDTPVRQLSLGQRMRCEVAAALLHRPKILFLDEPTIGLDAVSKLALRAFLREENRENGVTMILTTHDMDDIEALCSRVMVIGHGKLLYDGALSRLKERYAPLHCLSVKTEGAAHLTLPQAERVEAADGQARVWFDPNGVNVGALLADIGAQASFGAVTVQEQDIDEIIAAMYREMAL